MADESMGPQYPHTGPFPEGEGSEGGDEIAELLPAYALGALDAADAMVVERALDREPRYHELLEEHLESAAVLAGSHAFAAPSAQARERIMGHVRGRRAAPVARPAPRVPLRMLGVAAALAAMVVVLGAFTAAQQQRVAQLQDEVNVATTEAEGARNELVGLSDMVADGVVASRLAPAEDAPADADGKGAGEQWERAWAEKMDGRGRHPPRGVLMTGQDGESLLVMRGLRPLKQGYTYVAWWWDEDKQAKGSAAFAVDGNGYARVRLGDVSSMSRLAVSVESEPGAADPGPELVLRGHVDGGGDSAQ